MTLPELVAETMRHRRDLGFNDCYYSVLRVAIKAFNKVN